MKIAILTANLGNFDKDVKDPVEQNTTHKIFFHRFTDEDFPSITGLTPRFQYRIPKMFGWEMSPGFDIYIWLDGGMSLQHPDSIAWLLGQLGASDAAFFKHPDRNTIKEEVDHIEDHLQKGKPYITSRYKNGLHKKFYEEIHLRGYRDNVLYASTAFIYRNCDRSHGLLNVWWNLQSRYYTCDQVQLPVAIATSEAIVKRIDVDIFNNPYVSLVTHHK